MCSALPHSSARRGCHFGCAYQHMFTVRSRRSCERTWWSTRPPREDDVWFAWLHAAARVWIDRRVSAQRALPHQPLRSLPFSALRHKGRDEREMVRFCVSTALCRDRVRATGGEGSVCAAPSRDGSGPPPCVSARPFLAAQVRSARGCRERLHEAPRRVHARRGWGVGPTTIFFGAVNAH